MKKTLSFTPQTKDYQTKVEASFKRQNFMTHLNASLTDIRPGHCEIHILYDLKLTQQHGCFHAGIVSTIADNAAGYPAFSLMKSDSSILTVEY